MTVAARAADHPLPTLEVQPTAMLAARVHGSYAGPANAPFDAQAAVRPDAYRSAVQESLAGWANETPEVQPAAPTPRRPRAAAAAPTFDERMGGLREHPAMLRALGLVFDINLPADVASGAAGQVRVSWPDGAVVPGLPPIASPWSRFDRAFLPASADGQFSAGMLTLSADPALPPMPDRPSWRVETVDIEGAVRRLRGAGDANAAAGNSSAEPAMPALRSIGLQLLQVDRQRGLEAGRRASMGNARRAAAELVLDAGQLVLGVRLDVRQDGGLWRSTHLRRASYTVDGVPLAGDPLVEEGHLKLRSLVEADDGVLRASETVARWSGWSLSVPRPRLDAPAGADAVPPSGFGFAFAVLPGSLPRLRFASQYALRARAVDLAGHGLALEDAAADRCAIAQIAYGRHEPVLPPVLGLADGTAAQAFGPGESMDCIVIRSTPPQDAERFDAANPGYVSRSVRSLSPPPGSLDLAEQHGMVDRIADPERSLAIAARALAAGDPRRRSDVLPLPDPAAGGVQAAPLPLPGAPAAAFARQDWGARWPEPEPPKSMRLAARQAGQAALAWEGTSLMVRLAPAEQASIELSSSLTADMLDHFALRRDGSAAAAREGRNPLLTPCRTVRLVHAVRRPQWMPSDAVRLELQPRKAGQTAARLTPIPALLELQPNSAGQLDLHAEWTERHDDAPARSVSADLQSLRIDLGDVALQAPLEHAFDDTRHRDVLYTLTAVSRFRSFFHPEEEEAEPDAFVVRHTLAARISVPNTARPSRPSVLAARPALAWSASDSSEAAARLFVRRREGGRVRLELARPWFETGDGERLAVVLWAGEGPAPDGLSGQVSEIGNDPIFQTAPLARWMQAADFSGMSGAGALPFTGAAGLALMLLPFEPWFQDGRWMADIAAPGLAAAAYCPMLRLAVARYQPASIAGCELSQIVPAEFVALQPARECTVRQEAGRLTVVLSGIGPSGPFRNRVDVLLERRDAGGVWTALDGQAVSGRLGEALTLALQGDATGQLRVRVREVEQLAADTARPGGMAELDERLVFMQEIVLAS